MAKRNYVKRLPKSAKLVEIRDFYAVYESETNVYYVWLDGTIERL